MRKALTLFALMLAFFSLQVHAQERQITGKVISSQDNLGIPGVTVLEVGTTNATVTDLDGNYSLKVSATGKQLQFSYLGMATQTIDLGTSNSIDIKMESDAKKLNEVIVTANAISREKRSLGYATQQVTSAELRNGQNTNVIGALQGKIAGVNVNSNSGAPGSSNRIVIRGGTSLTGQNQALMVVDGIPINNSNFRTNDGSNRGTSDDLNNQVDYGNRGNDINPDDIESISILKGPAAAALYGSRASNGAIIITTKSGRRLAAGSGKGKSDVTFNSSLTFSNVLKLPEFQNQFGQGDVDNVYDDRRENFSWGLPFDGALRPWGQEINGQQRVKPYSALEDNTKDFFQTGISANNNVSFSGGSEKSSYFLSVGATNSKGIVPTSSYDKYNIRFNGSTDLSNYISTSINVAYTNIESVLPSGGQKEASIYDQLLQTPRDIPITESKDLTNIFNGYDDLTHTYGFYGAYALNPYFTLNNFKNTNSVDRVIGSFTVNYNKFSWMTITNRFGGDIYSDRRYQKWKKYNYSPIDGFYSPNDQVFQGKYSEDLYNNVGYNNDLMVTFKKTLSEKIKATLLVGQNIRQNTLTNTFAQTNSQGGLSLPDYYNLQNSNGPILGANSTTQTRNMGYYADLNFNYSNFLFLGLTGRNDQSSTLPTENSSYFYSSANAAFVFTELMNDSSRENFLSYGKIRASYAKVGNDARAYVTADKYTRTTIDGGWGSTTFPLGGVVGYSVFDQLGNPGIKPEFTTAFEIGAELSFIKDRITVDFSYYQNSSTDQIIPLALPAATGYTSKIINTGEVQNKGIELSLRGVPILTKSGFKLELFGTYTKNTNEVISLYSGVDQLVIGGFSGMAIVAQVGQPYGAFYATDLMTDPSGNVVVDPNSGLPRLSTNPVYKGSYQPDYIASFGTNISYKGWTLNVLFDMKQGGKYYSRNKDLMDFVGTSLETAYNNREDYVWAGSVVENPDGTFSPNTTPFHPYDYYTSVIPSGQHLIDASYVKLREVAIGYNFPSKWLAKTPFGSASLGIFGNNLAIWTAEENVYGDPELNSSGSSNAQGFDYSSNFSQTNYGVNLKFTF